MKQWKGESPAGEMEFDLPEKIVFSPFSPALFSLPPAYFLLLLSIYNCLVLIPHIPCSVFPPVPCPSQLVIAMTTTTATTTASFVLESPRISQEHQPTLLERQKALLLHGAQQPYTFVTDHAVPVIGKEGEILVKVVVIGLNPVDWKGPYVPPPPGKEETEG